MSPEIQFFFGALAWIVLACWFGARSQRHKRDRYDRELTRVISERFGSSDGQDAA